MLTIGDTLPSFSLLTVPGGELTRNFVTTTEKSHPGRWLVLFSWPKDFTFICPTEIAEFGKKAKDFSEREAQVLGFSTDTEFVHHAWREHNDDLKNLQIPMLADTKKELSQALGILAKNDGVIRFASVNDLNVGRSVPEVLRVLDALQTDELCPCNWQKGQKTLEGK